MENSLNIKRVYNTYMYWVILTKLDCTKFMGVVLVVQLTSSRLYGPSPAQHVNLD
jgi:hypothetical protein